MNQHTLDSHLAFDESDQLFGNRDAAVDYVGGIPVILVKDDLTIAVETHVTNANGFLPGPGGCLFEV